VGVERMQKAKVGVDAAAEIEDGTVMISRDRDRETVLSPSETAAMETRDAPMGSIAAVLNIQAECFADDVELAEGMENWNEARVRAFFENGGVDGLS